ncbi:MAG: hypothetical protein P3X24_001850, partial [bacterium]|nr:hypothetical protein [bacterium]
GHSCPCYSGWDFPVQASHARTGMSVIRGSLDFPVQASHARTGMSVLQWLGLSCPSIPRTDRNVRATR